MKRRNWTLRIGGCVAAVMVALILLGTVWTPYDPNALAGAEKSMAPCLAHLFGTDNFGRDLFSRVLEGGRACSSPFALWLSAGCAARSSAVLRAISAAWWMRC